MKKQKSNVIKMRPMTEETMSALLIATALDRGWFKKKYIKPAEKALKEFLIKTS